VASEGSAADQLSDGGPYDLWPLGSGGGFNTAIVFGRTSECGEFVLKNLQSAVCPLFAARFAKPRTKRCSAYTVSVTHLRETLGRDGAKPLEITLATARPLLDNRDMEA
jgi:hypothetical protein